MKKMHLFVFTVMLLIPVLVIAQENKIAELKKKEEATAALKTVPENKTTKTTFTASGKTIPPGMDVSKMVTKEFEKSGLLKKDANKIEEKKKTEQEKLAEERRANDAKLTSSATTKELAEKKPNPALKAVENGGYSKAPAPQNFSESKIYAQNNQAENKNTTATNSNGETKLYSAQEQYQKLPLKKSNEPDNVLSANAGASQNKNVLNQYDFVKPGQYDQASQPLNSSGTLPNKNQYGELKLSPRYDMAPAENNYTGAQTKSAAERKLEQEKLKQQEANLNSQYGPLPPNGNLVITKEKTEVSTYQSTEGALIKKQQANPNAQYGSTSLYQNANSNAVLTKEKTEVRTYQSTESALIKQKELAETKALQSQSEKTALTKERQQELDKIATEAKEAKEIKEAREAKEAKEIKEAKEAKEAKEVKEIKEAKEAKEAKEIKEAKEAREIQEARQKKLVEEKKKSSHG